MGIYTRKLQEQQGIIVSTTMYQRNITLLNGHSNEP